MEVWKIETAMEAPGFLTVNNATGSQIGLSMQLNRTDKPQQFLDLMGT